MADAEIISSVQRYLRNVSAQNIAVSFGVLFGSHAVGRASKWSDIDLLVVSPDFDDAISREQINQLWKVAANTDSRIEPIPCGHRQWQQDTTSAIIEIARQEGTPIHCN